MKRYFYVAGIMFNKIVIAESEAEVKGHIICELTADEAKAMYSNTDDIPNID